MSEKYVPRLQTQYQQLVPTLKEELGLANVHKVPRFEKVVVNVGLGEAVQNAKVLEGAMRDIGLIAGQKPVLRRAKKSIAGFKLREQMPIGASVTLRRQTMWEFLDRLINVTTPRIRDFRGFSPKAFDGRGNYSLGIKEHIVFSEIDYDKVDKIRGVGITIVTSAENDVQAKALLDKFGFPFRK